MTVDVSVVYILATAALLVVRSFLIAGLLLQRRKRRQAEDHVRRDEEALRGSYQRIRQRGTCLKIAVPLPKERAAEVTMVQTLG